MICPLCGTEFVSSHKNQRYCSRYCQIQYNNLKKTGKINHVKEPRETQKSKRENEPQYTPEQHQFLEKRSLENMVRSHLEELRKVHETNSAAHLTVCKRRGLIKQGILTISRSGKGSVWNLTPKAVKTLEIVQSS